MMQDLNVCEWVNLHAALLEQYHDSNTTGVAVRVGDTKEVWFPEVEGVCQ